MAKYSVTDFYRLRGLCIRNGWFTCGTNSQYDKMFEENENGAPIEEIATIIWICSDTKKFSNEEILAALKAEKEECISYLTGLPSPNCEIATAALGSANDITDKIFVDGEVKNGFKPECELSRDELLTFIEQISQDLYYGSRLKYNGSLRLRKRTVLYAAYKHLS